MDEPNQIDTTEAYRQGRIRITDLLRTAGEDGAARVTTACPEWTVKDVAAHLAGVDADILAGNLEGVASDPWTAAQVEARRDRSLAEVLDEWDDVGPKVEAALAGGHAPAQLVFDLCSHEHDIRHALGAPGARDADSTIVGIDFGLQGWSAMYPADGLPLRLVAGDHTVDVGAAGEPVTLGLDPFDAMRALSGRRSVAQIVAYDWSADPTPYLPIFTWGPFRPSRTDIIE